MSHSTTMRLAMAQLAADFVSFTIQAQEEESHAYGAVRMASISKDLNSLALMTSKEVKSAHANMRRADAYSNLQTLLVDATSEGRSHYAVKGLCERGMALLEARH
jgi:hypothetical protein